MSTTTTRVRTRSSSTQPVSVAECTETIDQLAKRTRHASKTGRAEKDSTPTGNVSTPTVEGTSSNLPRSREDDAVNPVAVKLWNQLFNTSDYMGIAGRDSFHTRVRKLLTEEQVQTVAALIEKDVTNRKVDFLKSKETDIPKLRLSLQEVFTRIVIRHVRSELALSKDDANTKLEHLNSLDNQALDKWYTRRDKNAERVKRVKGAQEGVVELLNFVIEKLNEEEESYPIYLVGSPEHTMTLIRDFLNEVVDNERVELPKIVEGEREVGNDDQLIYRKEYDQLPQDVREYFAEAIKLIKQANHAAQEEDDAVADYNLIHARINTENQDGAQLTDLKEKSSRD